MLGGQTLLVRSASSDKQVFENTKAKALQTVSLKGLHAINFGGANQSRTGLTGFAIRGITALLSRRYHKKPGAGKRVRTVDLYLGKVSLYQLSYSRIQKTYAS